MSRTIATPVFNDLIRNPFSRMFDNLTHSGWGTITVDGKEYVFEVDRIHNSRTPGWTIEHSPRVEYWCELRTVRLPKPSRRVPDEQMSDVRSAVIRAFQARVREMADAL